MTPGARGAAFALSLALAGCAAPRTGESPRALYDAPLSGRAGGIDIEGKLDVLGPTPDLVAAGLPGDWTREGRVAPGQARVVELDGVPALRLVPGDGGFILVRRIDAPAFMTPDLSWSWNMDFHGAGLHPVRLVVGFQGGAKDARGTSAPVGGTLPPHDRSFAIAWADSALRRGTVIKPEASEPRAPLYIARGGRENAGRWWFETVALQRIYRDLWPGDDPLRVRVVFIGLAVAPVPGNAPAAHVSGIRLSR